MRIEKITLTSDQIDLRQFAICRDEQFVLNNTLRREETLNRDCLSINQCDLQGLAVTHIGKYVVAAQVQGNILPGTDYNRSIATNTGNGSTL